MLTSNHRVTVLGGGAWGTAVAQHCAQKFSVCLWSRDSTQLDQMKEQSENEKYLKGITLSDSIEYCSDLDMAIAKANRPTDLVVVATPIAGLESIGRRFLRNPPHNVILLCKGVDPTRLLLPHQIIESIDLSGVNYGILSGPSFAQEVARGLPAALVVASHSDTLIGLTQKIFHMKAMRIYPSTDVIGVAIAGAVKNVLAIASGINDGLDLGQNSRAALLTRGLAEMSRLGVALGGKADTFMGLAGIGDLMLTATGNLSRNRFVGLELAKNRKLNDILNSLGHVAEGVNCAKAVLQLAVSHEVEMPIVSAVSQVLFDDLSPNLALEQLLSRQAKHTEMPD